jgi:hypothetical protein
MMNEHTRLVFSVGRKCPSLLGGHSSVTIDNSTHNTSSMLDTDGKRSYIKQQELRKFIGLVISSPFRFYTPPGESFFGQMILEASWQ